MATKTPQPALKKAMLVFESLQEHGFRGKTLTQLRYEFDMPKTTCWRLLNTFEEGGWVIRKPGGRQQEDIWQISPKFLSILANYRLYMQDRMEKIRMEYKSVTGEELEA